MPDAQCGRSQRRRLERTTIRQGTLELYVINTDGTGLRKITDPCVDNYEVGTYLLWTPIRSSPDGGQVLANCYYCAPPPDASPLKIYVVNPAEGTSRFLTHGTAYDWHVPSM